MVENGWSKREGGGRGFFELVSRDTRIKRMEIKNYESAGAIPHTRLRELKTSSVTPSSSLLAGELFYRSAAIREDGSG